MEFIISHADITAPNGDRAIGIDVQGNLGDLGIVGVATELANQDGDKTGRNHLADEAIVTGNRNDGATYIVRPNYFRTISSGDIAKAVANLINPCGVHDISFEPPLDR